ncbi:MAG: hypothetical protein QM655_15125 [Nocardioidaceae bacterium]
MSRKILMRRALVLPAAAVLVTLLVGCSGDGDNAAAPDRGSSTGADATVVAIGDKELRLERVSEASEFIASAVQTIDPSGRGAFGSSLMVGTTNYMSVRSNNLSRTSWRTSMSAVPPGADQMSVLNDVIRIGNTQWLHAPLAAIGSRHCWFESTSSRAGSLPASPTRLRQSLEGIGYSGTDLYVRVSLQDLKTALPLSIQRVFALDSSDLEGDVLGVVETDSGRISSIKIPGTALADSFNADEQDHVAAFIEGALLRHHARQAFSGQAS